MKTLSKFLAIFISILIVCLTLFSPIPGNIKLIVRIILLVTFSILWRLAVKKDLRDLKNISFILMVINLAFLIASLFTPEFWKLNTGTASGLALVKLSDSAIISLLLIASILIGGYSLKNIFLTAGRFIPGLIIGIFFFLVFGYIAFKNSQTIIGPGFFAKNLKWILVFVFTNSFMEELLFRAIFLEKLNVIFKPVWSILLTSVCFAVPHLTVNYSPNVLFFSGIVFVLGIICGCAMQYTRSIIAPTLIHAGADLIIILPIFATYGVTI
jgi:membrane protease YdiL (CAAX protease family)